MTLPSPRPLPEVEQTTKTLSDNLLWPQKPTFYPTRGALERAIIGVCSNSKRGYHPDKQELNQKGLILSENSENKVSETSVKTCVNNLFNILQNIQKWPLEYLERTLPPTVSNIVSGMVLGYQNPGASELQHKIKVTGMQHVMVASGSNIGLVYYSSLGVIGPILGIRRACLISLAAIVGYILMIGVEPPVMRAGVMAAITVFSKVFLGRQIKAWWSLGLSGVLLVIIFPKWISSISFQLSMASSLSILMWLPMFQSSSSVLTQLDFLNQDSLKAPAMSILGKMGSILLEAFQMTVAAQMLTLPLVLHYFGEAGSLLLVANTILIPLVPVITLSGFAYLLAGTVISWLSFDIVQELWSISVFIPTWLFIDGLTWISQFQLPVWEVNEFSVTAVVAWWAAVGLAYATLQIMRHSFPPKTSQYTSSRAR